MINTVTRRVLAPGILLVVACGDNDSAGQPTDASAPDANLADATPRLCDPVTQQGCPAGTKCGTLIDSVGPFSARTICVPNGVVPPGGDCSVGPPGPTTGYDDCMASPSSGYQCINGVCLEICPRNLSSCSGDAFCNVYDGLFEDVGDGASTGVCATSCDVVAQSCPSAEDGCYHHFRSNAGVCAAIPPPAATAEQNDPCYGPNGPGGGPCFLNGCARGHGAVVPDDPDSQMPSFLCAFFCTPDNTTLNQGDAATAVGKQTLFGQFDCNNDPGEARPGPGQNGSFECRFMNSFYADTGNVPPTVGFCVETATWGSCTAFDLEACVASPDPINDPACANATPGCVDHATLP